MAKGTGRGTTPYPQLLPPSPKSTHYTQSKLCFRSLITHNKQVHNVRNTSESIYIYIIYKVYSPAPVPMLNLQIWCSALDYKAISVSIGSNLVLNGREYTNLQITSLFGIRWLTDQTPQDVKHRKLQTLKQSPQTQNPATFIQLNSDLAVLGRVTHHFRHVLKIKHI